MSEGLGIQSLHHIGFTVKDVDVSKAFYEKLGFQFLTGG